jgi:hypothetical protein
MSCCPIFQDGTVSQIAVKKPPQNSLTDFNYTSLKEPAFVYDVY